MKNLCVTAPIDFVSEDNCELESAYFSNLAHWEHFRATEDPLDAMTHNNFIPFSPQGAHRNKEQACTVVLSDIATE